MNRADITSVAPIVEMKGENEEETNGLTQMFKDAREFLSLFSWCLGIEESYFGFGYAGIVAVFLFRIIPNRSDIDDWLWVIAGDLPPAYLVTEGNLTPDLAVEGYMREMTRWVEAVKNGRAVSGLIPVNAPATRENAEILERKLHALRQIIMDSVSPFKTKQVSREVQ